MNADMIAAIIVIVWCGIGLIALPWLCGCRLDYTKDTHGP
jgi:hypothetical protein